MPEQPTPTAEMAPSDAVAKATVPVEIVSRWDSAVPDARRGSPRSVEAVRARVAHTQRGNRRIDLFVTQPVLARLGWVVGGHVSVCRDGHFNGLRLRVSPAHSGLTLHRPSEKSGTCRVAVTASFIRKSICAPVRTVQFTVDGGCLMVDLPAVWASSSGDAA